MTSRSDPMTTMLSTVSYTEQHRILAVERTMRAAARWLQGNLRNIHVDCCESFGDEQLMITITVKVSDVLALAKAEKPKARRDNS